MNVIPHFVSRSLLWALLAFLPASEILEAAETPIAPLPYNLSAYELAPEYRIDQSKPWTQEAAKQEFNVRLATERQRREMDVYYYRIGYTLSFPLRPETRPRLEQLPAGIPGMKYPYLIWLAWNMEERWRLFHTAWRQFGDREAGLILQRELAALEGWDKFAEVNDSVGLVTGHFAGVLALALSDSSGWDKDYLASARNAATALINRDIWPWFLEQWKPKELGPRQIGNIPVIALVRAAQLARVISSEHTNALDERSREVLRAWCRLRTSEGHTEGTAYDGFLMDSITEWLAALPERRALLLECAPAFQSLQDCWVGLTLPGRVDLQTPLGDVEPEMTFWVNALGRMNAWQPSAEASWLLNRFPLPRMRAPALINALNGTPQPGEAESPPTRLNRQLPHAVSFRTGWTERDLLVVVGLSGGQMGHLHRDSGSLILGWNSRFWLTDPGYQQYRPGDERLFTTGPDAHNNPVVNDVAQSLREAEVTELSLDRQHLAMNLTKCYRGLPETASVNRTVSISHEGTRTTVIAGDEFSGFKPGTLIRTSWQGGHHLAWAFRDGWARLSDGKRALWIGAGSGEIKASDLSRHPGSRGPLTLTHTNTLLQGAGTNLWIFCCDPSLSWNPPKNKLSQNSSY